MKNKIILLAVISMLAMTACSAEAETAGITAGTDQPAQAATETTTDEWQYFSLPRPEFFHSYDALMDEINNDAPTDIYIHSLPEIVDTWSFEYGSYCTSNYTVSYNDDENDVRVVLEIDYTSSYEKISEYFDCIGKSMYSDVSEMYDSYAVRHYTEDDTYAIIGLTGNDNIMYTLLARSEDGRDPVELLKEYKDILEL